MPGRNPTILSRSLPTVTPRTLSRVLMAVGGEERLVTEVPEQV
jgi:hypothetical protein